MRHSAESAVCNSTDYGIGVSLKYENEINFVTVEITT